MAIFLADSVTFHLSFFCYDELCISTHSIVFVKVRICINILRDNVCNYTAAYKHSNT